MPLKCVAIPTHNFSLAVMLHPQDSVFVRDIINFIGREDNAMMYDKEPLGLYVPRAQKKSKEGICGWIKLFC